MRILVTGATGLLGNNLVRALLVQNHTVRVLVRKTSDPRPLAGLDVERVEGDVRNAEAILKACHGVDAVIHSAGLVHIGWSGLAIQEAVNVVGTRNIAQAARREGIRMVHVSSIDALGMGSQENPVNEETPLEKPRVPCPYVVTKRASELEVLAEVGKGLEATIVNPGFMLGPWDWKPTSGRMLLEVAQGRAIFAPRGANNYCDVRDVTEGILTALEKGRTGRRYLLGGLSLRYIDAWRIFAEVTGARRPLGQAGPAMLWIGGKLGDLTYRLTGREPDVNSALTAMSRLPKYYSHERAKDELGYCVRDLRETVTDAWRWFCENGYVK